MEIPRHWRLKKQRYNLVGEQCPHCDEKIFPPRDICPECTGVTKTATKDTQSTPFISPDEAAVLAAGARAYIASGRMAPYVVREVAEEIHKWLNASEWK